MHKIRWGLCCLFHSEPIKFRTARASHFAKLTTQGKSYTEILEQIILDNLSSLAAAIYYCAAHGIGSFRITSQLLPLATHPQIGYRCQDLPQAALILEKFAQCRQLAAQHGIRLTFHPDQFVVLNSPHPHVVESAIAELEYHAEMAALLGADVINIHAGGVYGDKAKALTQLTTNFERLSEQVRTRLTLENDDKCFTPADLLPVCRALRIPLVYDVHHHRCLSDQMTIEQASDAAYMTWNREPLFHISSPKEGWQGPKPAHHHDYIDNNDFPLYWMRLLPLTIEVEAKAKELAIKHLSNRLLTLLE